MSCSIFWSLSGVLEVKDGLDRTHENTDKNGNNFMHWNVSPDALPGSATNGPGSTGLTAAIHHK